MSHQVEQIFEYTRKPVCEWMCTVHNQRQTLMVTQSAHFDLVMRLEA